MTLPGLLKTVISAGAMVDSLRDFFGSAQLRYVGPRPLIDDNAVRSADTNLVKSRRRIQGVEEGCRRRVNLFNADVSDIDYYYAS